MKINTVIQILEEWAPSAYAEDFDNVGLLVGNSNTEVSGILVTLDTLESVVEEAIAKDCNLIVSFHPIVFKGIKKFTGQSYVERVVMKAIQHNIAIFAIHTALDNAQKGVNDMMCEQLGLENRTILIPQQGTIKKLTTYIPKQATDQVKKALFKAGAGSIGNYDQCSFSTEGTGSFRPLATAQPAIGSVGTLHYEKEDQLQCTYPKHREKAILTALFQSHPYEEVAYEIIPLQNINQHIGMGMVGTLPQPMNEMEALQHIKNTFQTGCIRHSKCLGKVVSKIAVLGGSGSFAIPAAKQAGADIFITADLKYHQFYEAEHQLILADIGHYESEQFTKNLILTYLRKKISNFAAALPSSKVILSDINTNPIQYL